MAGANRVGGSISLESTPPSRGRRSLRSQIVAPAAIALLAAATWACSPDRSGDQRFHEPIDVSRIDHELFLEPVAEEPFTREQRDHWTLAHLLPRDSPGDAWLVGSDHEDPYLWRRVDLKASAVDVIRLFLRPGDGWSEVTGAVELFWSSSEPPAFDSLRRLDVVEVPEPTRRTISFDFPVAAHENWEGRITALRIDLGSFPPTGASVELISLKGYRVRRSVLEEDLVADLHGDHRLSWLLPPGHGRDLELEIPARASLRFGYGRGRNVPSLPTDPEPRELRVAVRDAGGGLLETAPAPERDLLRIVLPPESGSWRDARIALDHLAGRRVRLLFEATGDELRTWPANPILVSGVEIVEEGDGLAREVLPRPNIVWIVADTLRADRLSLYGHRRVTSPRIDEWARESGSTFLHAATASTWTLPSHVSMLTGLDPRSHGVRYPREVPSTTLPFLPEILWKAGYATAAFTGGGFVGPNQGLLHGFDSFDAWFGQAGATAEIGTQAGKAIRWLRTRGERPFFLFFHTYETHSPFRPRAPHFSELYPGRELPAELEVELVAGHDPKSHSASATLRLEPDGRELGTDGEDRRLVEALYDSEVAELDLWFGEILGELERLGIREDTLIVFTSDHGESLGERGLYGHGNLHEENVVVPLVISYPRRFPGARTIESQVGLVDLVPTILDVLGLEPPGGLDGTSRVSALEGEDHPGADVRTSAAWTNRGVVLRSSGRKFAVHLSDNVWPDSCGRIRVFEPGKEETPRTPDPATNRWLSEVIPTLLDAGEGLAIRVRASSSPVRLGLRGDPLLARSLKYGGGACPEVEELPDGLVLIVPPGKESRFFWTGPDPTPLRLFLDGEDRSLQIRPLEIPASGLVLVGSEGIWSAGHPEPGAAPSVELEWRPGWGGGPSAERADVADPAVTERTLESLGYL